MEERVCCQRHEGNAVIAKCSACGAGICRECRDEFGYFCGKECLEKVRGTVDPVQKVERKKAAAQTQSLERTMGFLFKAIALAIVLIVAYGAWSLFFAPYGKLAWSWNGKVSPSDFIRLDSAPGTLLFLSQGCASLVDCSKGQAISVKEEKRLDGLSELVGKAGELSVLRGEAAIGAISSDGSLVWRKDIPGKVVVNLKDGQSEKNGNPDFFSRRLLFVSASQSAVMAISAPLRRLGISINEKAFDESGKLVGEREVPPEEDVMTVSALSPSDGSLLWEKPLAKDEWVSKLTAGNGCFAIASARYGKDREELSLKVCDLKTGAPKWQVKPKTLGSWGPEFLGDALVFATSDSLNAVKADGSGKLWSLPLGRYGLMGESVKIRGSFLIVAHESELSCVDLEAQKPLWTQDAGVYVYAFDADAGRVFVQGSKTAEAAAPKDVKLPDTMEGLKEEGLSKEGLAALAKNVKRSETLLTAFDLKSGKQLWARGKATGRLVCGDGRLALTTDTARDMMISVIGGSNKGDSCVFQINPANGADVTNGKNPIGLCAPYFIVGKTLVGVVYDRDTGGSPAFGMGKRQQESFLGLAGFRLK